MTFNKMLVLLFQPSYGAELYGTKHVLFGSGWLTIMSLPLQPDAQVHLRGANRHLVLDYDQPESVCVEPEPDRDQLPLRLRFLFGLALHSGHPGELLGDFPCSAGPGK